MTKEESETFEQLADSIQLISQSFSGDLLDSVNFHAIGKEHIQQMVTMNETLHQIAYSMERIASILSDR